MCSFLGVPIVTRERVVGILCLIEKEGANEFSEDDQRLIEILVAHAATYIENARLYDEVLRSTISRPLLGQMQRDLQAMGDLSKGAIFRAGQELATRVEVETLPQFLKIFAAMGLGMLTLVEADEARRRWIFSGDKLVEHLGTSDQPTDNYTLGFLCGAVARVLGGAHVAGVETTCQSMDDKVCRFVVQVVK